MHSPADIAALLEAHDESRGLLAVVAGLGLPDCWIGAGFVRNAVWDVLHGRQIDLADLNDLDVVYFDPHDTREARDRDLEDRLKSLRPGLAWSVKNQARMHLRNRDRPYRDTQDAIAHWPETATAIAARIVDGRVGIVAPHGIGDLTGLVVRPTPAFREKMEIYRARLAAKDWSARWPRLTFVGA